MAARALDFRDVAVRRAGRTILRDVGFTAHAGEVTAIVGPNGAGKSTLLCAAAGLVPHAGSITVDGVELAALPVRDRARLVTYLPQASRLEAALPVSEVIAHGRFAHRRLVGGLAAADRARIARVAEATGVAELLARPYTHLSQGERRRVLLARALVTEAPVMLLDEPTASLDIRQVLGLFGTIAAAAASGRIVVLVLHQLHEITEIADRVVMLCEGKLAANGETRAVLTEDTVRAVYGVALESTPRFGCRLADPGDAA